MTYNAKEMGFRAYTIRKIKHISKRKMAKELKMSPSTLTRFENGEYSIQCSKLINLCDILDISFGILLCDELFSGLTPEECLDLDHFMKYLVSLRKP
jgi:transcriptional regulator with XRE-family HTH domain